MSFANMQAKRQQQQKECSMTDNDRRALERSGRSSGKAEKSEDSNIADMPRFEARVQDGIRELQDFNRHLKREIALCSKQAHWKSQGSFDESKDKSRDIIPRVESSFQDWGASVQSHAVQRFAHEKLRKAFDMEKQSCLKNLEEFKQAVAQAKADEARQEQLARYKEIDSIKALGPQLPKELNGPCDADEFDPNQPSDQTQEIQYAMAQENSQGVQRIQEQVGEVNQIFKDLATIVNEQGQKLESIETAAENAAVSTSKATEELQKAARRQGSGGCCVRWLFVISVVVLFLILFPEQISSRLSMVRTGAPQEQTQLKGVAKAPRIPSLEEQHAVEVVKGGNDKNFHCTESSDPRSKNGKASIRPTNVRCRPEQVEKRPEV